MYVKDTSSYSSQTTYHGGHAERARFWKNMRTRLQMLSSAFARVDVEPEAFGSSSQ